MSKKLGDYFKKLRKDLDMTLEDFAYSVELSKSYINQIEKNERIPSKNTLFSIICYFNVFQKIKPQLPDNEILDVFSELKGLDKTKTRREYWGYVERFLRNLQDRQKELGYSIDSLDNNRLEYPTDHSKPIKELEKPYFDLEWLLSQNEFHVFWGNKFFTDKNQIHTDPTDEITYSKLNDDDKKMIKEIVESIFKTKYNQKKFSDKLEKKK